MLPHRKYCCLNRSVAYEAILLKSLFLCLKKMSVMRIKTLFPIRCKDCSVIAVLGKAQVEAHTEELSP